MKTKNAIRYAVLLVLVCLSILASAQKNYFRTDALGLLYKSMSPEKYRPMRGDKYSIGYERGLQNPHLAISFLLNYGYTPHYSTEETAIGLSGGKNRRGLFLFNDLRYYHLFKKEDDLRLKQSIHDGFFVGVYAGVMYLNEQRYGSLGFSFSAIDSYNIWIYGLGGLMGYKQMILKHFFVEPLIGVAYGMSNIQSVRPTNAAEPYSFDLWRLELSLGYAF